MDTASEAEHTLVQTRQRGCREKRDAFMWLHRHSTNTNNSESPHTLDEKENLQWWCATRGSFCGDFTAICAFDEPVCVMNKPTQSVFSASTHAQLTLHDEKKEK